MKRSIPLQNDGDHATGREREQAKDGEEEGEKAAHNRQPLGQEADPPGKPKHFGVYACRRENNDKAQTLHWGRAPLASGSGRTGLLCPHSAGFASLHVFLLFR